MSVGWPPALGIINLIPLLFWWHLSIQILLLFFSLFVAQVLDRLPRPATRPHRPPPLAAAHCARKYCEKLKDFDALECCTWGEKCAEWGRRLRGCVSASIMTPIRERERREGEKDRAARTPAGKLMQLLLFFCLSFHFSSSLSPSSEWKVAKSEILQHRLTVIVYAKGVAVLLKFTYEGIIYLFILAAH